MSPLASTITSGSSSNDISDPANSAARIATTSSVTGFIIDRDKERDDIRRMLHESVCEPASSNSKVLFSDWYLRYCWFWEDNTSTCFYL